MSKALIEAYIEALWNKKQLEVIPRVVSSDVTIHAALGTFYGCKAMHHIVSTWITAFPDLEITMKNLAAEKDLIFVHFHASGIHKNEFFQIPASNNLISFNGVAIYRVANSMITECWVYIDTHNIRSQLLAKDINAETGVVNVLG